MSPDAPSGSFPWSWTLHVFQSLSPTGTGYFLLQHYQPVGNPQSFPSHSWHSCSQSSVMWAVLGLSQSERLQSNPETSLVPVMCKAMPAPFRVSFICGGYQALGLFTESGLLLKESIKSYCSLSRCADWGKGDEYALWILNALKTKSPLTMDSLRHRSELPWQ